MSIRACVRAYVVRPRGTAKPMAWTGMWVMSVFSSIAFRDGDGRPLDLSAGYVVRRESRVSSFSPARLPSSTFPLLAALLSGWIRGPAILFQLPDQRRDPVALRSLRRRAV